MGQQQAEKIEAQLGDPGLDELLTKPLHDTLSEDIELLDGAAYEFNLDKVRHGMLTPVFFGSALTNFGVCLLYTSRTERKNPPWKPAYPAAPA